MQMQRGKEQANQAGVGNGDPNGNRENLNAWIQQQSYGALNNPVYPPAYAASGYYAPYGMTSGTLWMNGDTGPYINSYSRIPPEMCNMEGIYAGIPVSYPSQPGVQHAAYAYYPNASEYSAWAASLQGKMYENLHHVNQSLQNLDLNAMKYPNNVSSAYEKKTTWASVASKAAKTVHPSSGIGKRKGPGMPPPPVTPGKIDNETKSSAQMVPPSGGCAVAKTVWPNAITVQNTAPGAFFTFQNTLPPPSPHFNVSTPPPNTIEGNATSLPVHIHNQFLPPPSQPVSVSQAMESKQNDQLKLATKQQQVEPHSQEITKPSKVEEPEQKKPTEELKPVEEVHQECSEFKEQKKVKEDDEVLSPPRTSLSVLEQLKGKNNYNPKDFDLDVKGARFFVIKSYSEDDVYRSIKHEIWCSTEHGNRRLDEAYKGCEKGNGAVYLLFSVNGSGYFCGVARMVSSVDYNSSSSVWAQDKWKGQFKVRWIYVKDVPNRFLRHIRLENNENKPVTNSRDTQEVPYDKGVAVLRIIHSFENTTSLFDDFGHYEEKQEGEKAKKVADSCQFNRQKDNGQQRSSAYRKESDRDRDRGKHIDISSSSFEKHAYNTRENTAYNRERMYSSRENGVHRNQNTYDRDRGYRNNNRSRSYYQDNNNYRNPRYEN